MRKEHTPAVEATIKTTVEPGDLVRYDFWGEGTGYGTVVTFDTMVEQGALGRTAQRAEFKESVLAHWNIEEKAESQSDFPIGWRHVGGVMSKKSCKVYDFETNKWLDIDNVDLV